MTTNLQVVKSLSPKQPHVNIRVKVLAVETVSIKSFDQGKPFLDFIVCDDDGDRISLTIKNFQKAKYEKILQPQGHYLLNRVFVNNNTSRSKNLHASSSCKLMFEAKTTVLPLDKSAWGGASGFNFRSFADLLTTTVEGASADVIGMVSKYSEEKQYGDTDDEQSKYRVITLKDLDGLTLSCTLWGKFMRLFLHYVQSEEERQCVIMVVQFAKTKKHGDDMTIRSDWSFTQVLFDADITDVSDFRKRFVEMNAASESGISLVPSLTPPTDDLEKWFKHVTCVGCDELDISTPGTYAVQAEIIAILPDDEWCYIGCKKCFKKAPPVDPLVDLTLGIDDLLSLKRRCSGKCGDSPKVGLRFKVGVRVSDKTDDGNGTSNMTLFESQVSKFVFTSAYHLHKSLPEDQEQPEELDELLGKVLIFKVDVTEYTLAKDNPVYTVKDAVGDAIYVEKFIENYNAFKGKRTTSYVTPADTSSQPISSAKCGSSKGLEELSVANLGTSTGFTPPKKVIKKEPTASPLSVRSSSTKAKKSIQLDN